MNVSALEKMIVQELQAMPPEAAQEVLDFTRFIKQRWHTRRDIGIQTRRKAGALRGQIKMSDDFNAPLDDFADYQ